MHYWNVHLFYLVNHFAGRWPAFDRLMIFFANSGPFLYAGLMILAWFVLPRREGDKRHALVTAVLAGVVALGINYVVGLFWFSPRPFVVLPAHSFTQLVAHTPDNSFPSDHAAGSFAFAAASWGTTPRWISATFTAIALIVMVARVFVGVHWPIDVVAGMLVGILSGRIMTRLSYLFWPITNFGLRLFRYGDYAPSPRFYR